MNSKKVLVTLVLALGLTCLAGPGFGATVIDFGSSTPVMGKIFDATGASFGEKFTVDASSLSLVAEDYTELAITGADGGASVSGSFIGNVDTSKDKNPLYDVAVLLDTWATQFSFTVGYVNQSGKVLTVERWGDSGFLGLENFDLISGRYNVFSFTSTEAFKGLLFKIWDAEDAAGLEIGNMSYTAVPVPAAVWLLGSALAGLVLVRRRE